VVVKGSADRFRDFVYIDDVVDAFLTAGRRSESGYAVFNICTGVKTTVASLLDQMKANLPYPVQVEFTSNTPGDQFGIVGDNSSARGQMNWTPKISLAEGMSRMVKWALASGSGR
jgi:UDP-glucose 4-epimerase